MKIYEAELKKLNDKAGMYPFYIDENGVGHVYLMIPSNPKFGGPQKQMGKGGVDEGENMEQAATRECVEELGLKPTNIKQMVSLHNQQITGQGGYHNFECFVCTLKDPDDFNKWGWESKWAGWVTLDEALKKSRPYQRKYIKMIQSRFMPEQVNEAWEPIDDEDEIKIYQNYLNDLGLKYSKTKGTQYKERRELRSQMSHMKSQIDLIKMGTTPVQQPQFPDPDMVSWNNWQEGITPMVDAIKKHCKPYLEVIDYDISIKRLYRGMRGASGPVVTGRVRLDDRNPTNTGTHVHQAVNEYFVKKFGEPFRNALFTSTDPDFAADYGNLFVIFPAGNFTFVWSEKIEDLFNYEHVIDEAIDDDRNNRGYKMVEATMDNYEYRDSGFIPALNSGNEIMIRTPVYYGINITHFFDRDDHDDSKGNVEATEHAIELIQELLKP